MIRRFCSSAGPLVLVAALLAGCSGPREAATPPAPTLEGTWDYTMMNPSQGELSGRMTITKADDGTYHAHITITEMGLDERHTLDSLETDGTVFTMRGSAAGTTYVMTGTLNGDTFSGENDVQGVGVFTINGTRVAEAM